MDSSNNSSSSASGSAAPNNSPNVSVPPAQAETQAAPAISPTVQEAKAPVEPTNIEQKPKKKKKHRFLKFLVVVLILIIGWAIISKLLRKDHDDIADLPVNKDGYFRYVEGELEIAYGKGEITADEYANILYDVYLGKSDYRGLSAMGNISDLYAFAAEHVDEISENTAKKIVAYFFGLPSVEDKKVSVDSGVRLASSMQTPEEVYSFTYLDHAVISSNHRFIVYYTKDGLNATTDKYAREIADILENTADTYGEMTGYPYKYERINYSVKDAYSDTFAYQLPLGEEFFTALDKVKNKAISVLESEGIPTEYIDTAMPVYITATGKYDDVVAGNSNGVLAAYTSASVLTSIAKILCSFDGLSKALMENQLGEDVWELAYYPMTTIYQVPYINISKYGEKNEESLRFVAAHEMFHHFQQYICGDGNYAECLQQEYQPGIGNFDCHATFDSNYEYVSGSHNHMACNGGKNTLEGMANVAAFYATQPKNPIDVANQHAAASVMFYEHGPEQDATDGYSAWVYLYYYTKTVKDGFKVAMNSSKYKDPNNYLIDHLESKQQGQDIMNGYIERMLTLDYPSDAMYPIAFDEIVRPRSHGGFKDDGEMHSEGTIRGYSYIRYGNASEMDSNKYIYIHKLDGNSINFNLLVNDGGGWKSIKVGEELVVPIGALQNYTEFAIAAVDGLVDGIDDTGLYEYKIMTRDEIPNDALLGEISELLDKAKPFWLDSDVVYCSTRWTEVDDDDGDNYDMWLEYKMKFKGDELKGLSIDGTMKPLYEKNSFSWAIPVTAIYTWASDVVENRYPHSLSWYPWHDNQIDFHWRFYSNEFEYLESNFDQSFENNKMGIVRVFNANDYTCGVK